LVAAEDEAAATREVKAFVGVINKAKEISIA
jgi:hypothetical protein